MDSAWDSTVDFLAPGELEAALRSAGAVDGEPMVVLVPADGDEAHLYTGDSEFPEPGADDWCVFGASVDELCAALRALV